MIRIVDYGIGNILAFHNMYKRLNIEATIARSAAELEGATHVILAGVGAFDSAMRLLNASGMREPLDEMVRGGVPVLGVCVGMQMLARSSSEGTEAGLGWIDGEVKGFASLGTSLMLPHMGWNDVHPTGNSTLFRGLEDDSRFYFLHSFYFECDRAENVAGITTYGIDFACSVHAGNVHGVQFHPEKSHHFGAQLLKNFAES